MARTLVRAGGTAIRRKRNVQHIHAAVAHRFELLSECHRLRAGLPRMQHAILRIGIVETGNRVIEKIDSGRDDQPVVTQHVAARQPHLALHRVDRDRIVAHQGNAALLETVVAERDVLKLYAAAEHQITDRAGNELGCALDHRHVDIRRPHFHVSRRRRAAIAGADHDHAAGAAGRRRTAAHRGRACGRGNPLDELASGDSHGRPPQYPLRGAGAAAAGFTAAKYAAISSSCSSL